MVVRLGIEPETSHTADWCLTNWANQAAVSSQQTLVLIYLPQKDGKLSWLGWKRRLYKYSNLGKAEDRTGDLVVRR